MSECASIRLLLHGLIDGELDAANAMRCEAHLATCSACAAAAREIRELSADMQAVDTHYPAPSGLVSRVAQSLEPATRWPWLARMKPSWPTLSLGGGFSALAVSLLVVLMVPRGPDIPSELVASHVRSLQATHLVDVETSDRHTVKPWFAGRVDFSPPVIDTSAAGFTLVGGRLDYVDGRPVAAIVYRRRLHVINLFVWPDSGRSTGARSSGGYNLAGWSLNGMAHWAVSDLNPAELRQFEALIEAGEAQSN